MKKALNIVKNILVWLLVAVAVGMMIFTIFSVNSFDQNNRSIFGCKFFIVRSDSMAATDFNAGDIVIVRETDPATLAEGDIIAYISQNTDSYGQTITHKIRRLTTTASGEPGFVTYGTTTDTDDELIVTYPYVLGKYTRSIPKMGTFFTFLKTTPGYICCILIPFLLLIAYQGLNCIRLFRQYKVEELEEMQEERKKLEEERAESQKMMAELLELRRQMGIAPSAETAEATASGPSEAPPEQPETVPEEAPQEGEQEEPAAK